MDVLLPEVRVGWVPFLELVCSGWFLVLDLGLHLGPPTSTSCEVSSKLRSPRPSLWDPCVGSGLRVQI